MMDAMANIFLDQGSLSQSGVGAAGMGAGQGKQSGDRFAAEMRKQEQQTPASKTSQASERSSKNDTPATRNEQNNAASRSQENADQQTVADKVETKPAQGQSEKDEQSGQGPQQAAQRMEEKADDEKALPAQAEHGQTQSSEKHAMLAELFRQMVEDKLKAGELPELTTEESIDDLSSLLPELEDLIVGGEEETDPTTTLEALVAEVSETSDDTATEEVVELPQEVVNMVAQADVEVEDLAEDIEETAAELARRGAVRADQIPQHLKSGEREKPSEKQLVSADELASEEESEHLVQETLRQLERNSTRFETIVEARNAQQKQQSAAELFDQLTEKMSLIGGAERGAGSTNSASAGVRPLSATGTPSYVMNTPLESEEWGAVFSKRINFLVKNGVQTAELRLDPPEMGRVNIKIKMSQEHASIQFTAQHNNVREAIETAMPRLRDMLSESGLSLGNVDVSTQQFAQRQHDGAHGQEGRLGKPIFPGSGGDNGEDDVVSESSGKMRGLSTDNLVDYYA
ncbi:MAG: flagellar hook-length control protein FliK [Gammaproteobacteria bacterium]|nr:flagellar hook-length control protein FliK [Gammaproteobacteria bacterium]